MQNIYMDEEEILQDILKILKKYHLDNIIKEIKEGIENLIENGVEYLKFRQNNGFVELADIELVGLSKTRSRNVFGKYFESLSTNRVNDQGIFYHFIKYDYLYPILEPNKIKPNRIRMYSLEHQLYNDPLEFDDFKTIISPQPLWFDKKDRIFIFCFTKGFRKNEFWETYGKNDENNKIENVAIGFRFNKFNISSSFFNPIIFRDVIYNTDNKFDFMREIQSTLKQKYNLYFKFDNIGPFAGLFKRGKFEWEEETRLYFNSQKRDIGEHFDLPGLNLGKDCVVNDDYAEIQLKNNVFELQIEEIICGKDMDNDKYAELKKIAKGKNINIWKYNF